MRGRTTATLLAVGPSPATHARMRNDTTRSNPSEAPPSTSKRAGRSVSRAMPAASLAAMRHASSVTSRGSAITKQDSDESVTVMDQWWGGPSGTAPLTIFFYEFGASALITEENGTMVGFLLGFVTERQPRIGYVHLVGIHPQYRRRGVAKAL